MPSLLKYTSIFVQVQLFDAISEFNRDHLNDKVERSAVCRAALEESLKIKLKAHGILTEYKKKYPLLRREKQ